MGLFENQSYFINQQKELVNSISIIAEQDDHIDYIDDTAEQISEEMPDESDYAIQDAQVLRADPFEQNTKADEQFPFIAKLPDSEDFFKLFPIIVTFLTGSEVMQATNLFVYTLSANPSDYLVYIFYCLVLTVSFNVVKFAWQPASLLFQVFAWLKCACMFLSCVLLNQKSIHFSSVQGCQGGIFQIDGQKIVKCNDFVNGFSFICVICFTEVVIIVSLFAIWLLNLSTLKGKLRQEALAKYVQSLDKSSIIYKSRSNILKTSNV